MSAIKKVFAREILDSRGSPTVEVEITTSEGVFRAAAPSGASTGSSEAVELRDGGRRFFGKGVLKAVANVNLKIAGKVAGLDCRDQNFVDSELIALDGTKNKSRFGANATVAVSMAVAKAGSAAKGVALYEHVSKLAGTSPRMPVPMCNLINGGAHAGLENDFQEHMVAPVGAKNFGEALRAVDETYFELRKLLGKKINTHLVADEGGLVFGKTPQERLEALEKAARNAGHGKLISLALDCSASQFYKKGSYRLGKQKMSALQLEKYYDRLVGRYAIFSIEDGFAEEDWQAWRKFSSSNASLQVVGDDLLTTNPSRIMKAIAMRACNALLLKPNQIGTVSESLVAFSLARRAGWKTIVSHRSGETGDVFISHLAVGLGCGQCKFGAPARGERILKYNELLRISEKVGRYGVV